MTLKDIDKKNIKEIFSAGVNRVSGYNAVASYLKDNEIEGSYKLIAIGKAASSMSLAILENKDIIIKSGIVITKIDHTDKKLLIYKNINCIESDHPTPSDKSIIAGESLINYLNSCKENDKFIFLISGGGSSLVESLVDGFSLENLKEITGVLLSKGYNISQINNIRKNISNIKGGKLSSYLKRRDTICLLISDVPNDIPSVIASGPLVPDYNTLNLEDYDNDIRERLSGIKFNKCPDKEYFENISTNIIAKLDDAKKACEEKAKALNYKVFLNKNFIEGNVNKLSSYFSEYLVDAENGVHIWGGEPSVELPKSPGRGGRNQHLALLVAEKISNKPYIFLSAGTDGTDGVTDDAGAIVDGETIKKGNHAGLSSQDFISRADSGTYLEKVNAILHTGPTGTNVMDLIIAIK